MTLSHFEKLLQVVNPKLNIRMRGYGDVGGIYEGYEYILRVTKGELNMNGYRTTFYDEHGNALQSRIIKRGRKTIVALLTKRGLVTSLDQRELLLYGSGPLASKVK